MQPRIAATISTTEAASWTAGTVVRVMRRNISIGVKKGTSDSTTDSVPSGWLRICIISTSGTTRNMVIAPWKFCASCSVSKAAPMPA